MGVSVLAATLWCAASALAQNSPGLTGSSSAKASSAVTALALTAPSGLFPGNLMLANLSQSYGSGSSSVSLSSVANVDPYAASGTAPANGGLDGAGNSFRTDLVGTSLTYNGSTFTLCGSNTACGVTSGVIITLPSGNYSNINILATSGFGGASGIVGAVFTVTYTDGTTTNFTQNISDIQNASGYSGETIVSTTSYRVQGNGSNAYSGAGWHIYGYSFTLNSAKTVRFLTVPSTRNVQVLGVGLYSGPSSSTAPSGWTQLSTSSNGVVSQTLWYRIATSADVAALTTYAFSFPTSGQAAGSIMAFGGVATSSPVIATSSQSNATSANYTAPAVTWQSTQTWVGLYTAANGTTSGADFTTIGGASATIDTGTGSGASGVLIGGFELPVNQFCSSSCTTGTFYTTSRSNTSATSIGTSILLNGTLPAASALWHMDQSSWSGTSGEVVDSSGSGYNGVAVHGATTAGSTPALTGSPGTCFYGSFNGSTNYVQLPSTLPHVGGQFTVTGWVRATASTRSSIFWDNYNGNGYSIDFDDTGTNLVRFQILNPSAVHVDSAVALTLNQWYFVAAIMNTQGNPSMTLLVYNSGGTLLDTETSSGSVSFSAGTGSYATIGGDATGSVTNGIYPFPGNIDEVAIYDASLTASQVTGLVLAAHACASYAPDHYAVSAASSAVNCQATPITIAAHTSAHAALATTDTIALATSTGHGDWTLTTGSGTFAAGSSNSGSASYTYTQADGGSVVLSLRDTYAESVTINVTDGTATAKSGSAPASEDSPIAFAPSGFRITNGSNAATTIVTQSAGVTSTQSLALQAVRTDTATGACTSVFASGTTVNVSLAYQCNNPTSCVSGQTFSVTNNHTTTSLASNPNTGLASYTTVPLVFTTANGEAPIALNYTDAGQITLAAKYNIPLQNGGASANNMVGSSQFVVQPYTLKLSNISLSSSSAANPGASSASGTVFGAAGQAFTATVTAQNYQGSATPNFGQEIPSAIVTLTPLLVVPISGDNPPVSGSFGSFTSGAATGTAFSWPEVGIITLTPAVASSPGYLGSGGITGTASGNVGRFIPNAFSTTHNTPVLGTSCIAGGFGYVGQPFTYTVSPVITVTALAVGGTTAQNYTGSLMRLTNSSLTGRTYTPTPASPALIPSGLPSTSVDPAIFDLGAAQSTLAGQSTLTFSAGSGISFMRGSPIAPFTANIALSINVIDMDGVAAANPANPVTIGSGSGIGFSTGSNQYYGQLALHNALGSELLDLPMLLTTQYYLNTTQGFVTNTYDSCTAAPAITFSNPLINLQLNETCVRDSGSPGSSGQGCAAAASNRYSSTASAGAFNLILAAPGINNSGAMTVTATAPTWLQYLWNANSGSNSSPTGMATFGIFPGSPSRVYQREVY